MNKEKEVKKAGNSDNITKLEDLISRLPKNVEVKETRKGTVL